MSITWKEFKDAVESKGANDETEINYIDVSLPTDTDDLEISVYYGELSVCSY